MSPSAGMFEQALGRSPEFVSEAPGRVNLIGEHTDYNEGFVLPVAIDRTIAVAAAPADGKTVRAYSADFDARDEWRIDAPRRTGRREWRDYVRGVAWALLDAGYELRGADLAVAGDVPLGAGLSSSAALEVAVAGALCAVSGIEIEAQPAGGDCARRRRTSSSACSAGSWTSSPLLARAQVTPCSSIAGRWRWSTCRCRTIWRSWLSTRRCREELGETAYNQRREECAAAARALGVESLRDAADGDVANGCRRRSIAGRGMSLRRTGGCSRRSRRCAVG